MIARLRTMALALIAPLVLIGCVVTPGKFEATLDIAADRSFAFTYKGEVIAVDFNDSDCGPHAEPGDCEEHKKILDPKYEKAAAELRKQAGYRSVEYRGDGKFVIDYAVRGRLTHALIWPYNSEAEILVPFIMVDPRGENGVRVLAPAFGASKGTEDSRAKGLNDNRDGRFTLTTDATIVSQNGDEQQTTADGRRQIVWKVFPEMRVTPDVELTVAAAQ